MTVHHQDHLHAVRPSFGVLLVVLAMGLLAYASGAIFVRLAIQYDNADGLGFCLFLAASRMFVTALCCAPAWRGFRQANYEHRAITFSIIAGVFLALYFATWMTSLSFTTIAASTTLVNLNPLWVILLSWLWLHHCPSRSTLGGAGFAIMGAIIISADPTALATSGSAMPLGNGLALAGSGAISAYILFGHVAQKGNLKLGHHMVLMYTTAAIVLLPLPLLLNVSYFGHTGPTYICILLMALITQLLGHGCINWAVKWISPTVVSIFLLSEPLVASGLGYLAFREVPTLSVLLGGCIVLVGVTVAILGKESLASWRQLKSNVWQQVGLISRRNGGFPARRGKSAMVKDRPLGAIAKQPPCYPQRTLQHGVAYRSRPNYLAEPESMGDHRRHIE